MSEKTSGDIYILACETLKPELELVMKKLNCSYPLVWVDSGKHAWPDKLRIAVQEKLDGEFPPSCKTVLMVFGFCGNAMVGVHSRERTLVLPRAADCIPLYMGSRAEREAHGADAFFFTQGYLDSGSSMVDDSSRLFNRYGEKRALGILRKMTIHYKNFYIIDTGAFEVEVVKDRLEEFARLVDIPVSILPGNLRLMELLLSRAWNKDEFLVVPPGGSVAFADSLFQEGPGKGETRL